MLSFYQSPLDPAPPPSPPPKSKELDSRLEELDSQLEELESLFVDDDQSNVDESLSVDDDDELSLFSHWHVEYLFVFMRPHFLHFSIFDCFLVNYMPSLTDNLF